MATKQKSSLRKEVKTPGPTKSSSSDKVTNVVQEEKEQPSSTIKVELKELEKLFGETGILACLDLPGNASMADLVKILSSHVKESVDTKELLSILSEMDFKELDEQFLQIEKSKCLPKIISKYV